MKLLRKIKSGIPNTITSLNLLSGCIASVFAFADEAYFGSLQGYQIAFIFIGLATIFDFCDGLSARLLHAYSAIGKELDSLSDLVSFGVAPAMLVFNLLEGQNAGYWSFCAFLLAVFGALRLAKFNIDDRQTTSFIGLPIPANAIFWIGIVAWNHSYFYIGTPAMILLIVAFSWLMVSRLNMFSLKVKTLAFSSNVRRYVLILGTISFVAVQGVAGFAWAIIFYILLSATMRRNEQM
mgnify:CR=1 FL=1